MDLLRKNWVKFPEKAKSLFSFFLTKGLPLQADQSYNNALMHVIMKHPENLDLIEMLITQGKVNINSLVTPDTEKTCKFAKTPFSIAISRENPKLLLLLLEHGADPY